MSGKQAKRARQAEGYVKPPKVGTPLTERVIPMVQEQGRFNLNAVHPSHRQQKKLLGYMDVLGMEYPKEATE